MMLFAPNSSHPMLALWQEWRSDVGCVFARDPAARGWLEVLLAYPGVHAVLIYRVSHRWWQADFKLAARLLAAFCRWLTNVDIHPGAKIGKRFFIDHGAGVVIGETAEIGNDVTLYHGVTLGGTTWNQTKRHPTLGDNVLIGAGAKILGAITLGNNVRVGANSVVVKDVPPCCTVIGIPGRIIQQKGVKIQNPFGIDLDHHLVPDPVGKAISCLTDRLDKLEEDQEKLFSIRSTGDCAACEADTVCHGEDTVIGKQPAGLSLMDLLEFDAKDLYFEKEDSEDVQTLLRYAADLYASGEAELPLLQAYLRAPESLNVLVALNRFYYYQHRLQEALLISEKALALIRPGIGFPEDWTLLEINHISAAPKDLLTKIRLYLFTLKLVGFLNMRLENLALSRRIFEKLTDLDSKDRIGAKGLLALVVQRQEASVN